MRRLAIVAVVLLLVPVWSGCSESETSPASEASPSESGESASRQIPAQHLERILELANKGIGHMDRYEAKAAVEAFDEVVRLAPGWTTGRLNLGLALLNTQSDEDNQRAEVELLRVIDEDPESLHGHYALGMLLTHQTRFDQARNRFERVLAIDPSDPDAHYRLGVLLIEDDPAAARAHLERTLAALPHHEAACYRLQGLLRAAGETERATELLSRYRTLNEAQAGVSVGMKYGEMGRYANVIRNFALPGARLGGGPATLASAPRFSDVARERGLDIAAVGIAGWPGDRALELGAEAFAPGVAVADVDGDARLDVYLTGTAEGGALFLQGPERFVAAKESGIDGAGAVGAFFGDYDADGDPDLYLTCAGPNRLYRNEGEGRFVDVTAAGGVSGGALLSVGASWTDADHDGDLDLAVANFARWRSPVPVMGRAHAGAPNALFRNNGDGSFSDVAAAAGIDGKGTATVGVLVFDVDGDRDSDLYWINQESENRLFLNDRVGRYSPAPGSFAVLADDGHATGALLGDVDRNGLEDLLLLRGPEPARLLLQVGRGTYVESAAFAEIVESSNGAVGGLFADLDLDGDPDLVLCGAGAEGAFAERVLSNRGDGTFASAGTLGESTPLPVARGALAVDFDGDGSLELLVARAGRTPRLWHAPAPPGRHWLTVVPTARMERAGAWIDPAATGLSIEVKTGSRLQLARLSSASGYLANPPLQAHFGLGAGAKADYVRLVWSDAVLQSELEVPADQHWPIGKVERKPSSCPVLFSWDGERYAFVTDFLGVGGLGFFVAPGVYAPPDPTEDVRIPPRLVALRDGHYSLRIAEPLEEVSYIDQLELRVLDHPAELELYPDERFTGSPPFPTGRPFALRRRIFPRAAVTDRGQPVLERVLAIDRRYVEPPKLPRLTGYARDHWLELDFGDRLAALRGDKPLVLYLYGWVEYTYSHLNYAAYQAGLSMRSPCIELPDGHGGWRVAVQEAGFPAGLPRMMTLDVTELGLAEHGRLRIRTNMEVFWDQIFLAEDEPVPELVTTTLRPAVAELRPLGYPREYSPDGNDPTLYDYHRLDHGVPFKNLSGDYTGFGDVRALLRTVDDGFVIMGRGEEIVLEFDAATLGPLPEGWARSLFLHADGYCKDMDLYTAEGDTVGPLPFHAMENYPPAVDVGAGGAKKSPVASDMRRIEGR